ADLRRHDDRQDELAAVPGSGSLRSLVMRSSVVPSRTRRRLRALSLASLAAVALLTGPSGRAEENPAIVLTATQATYSLAAALTHGAPIEVRNVPAGGRAFSVLEDYIARRMDRLKP